MSFYAYGPEAILFNGSKVILRLRSFYAYSLDAILFMDQMSFYAYGSDVILFMD